MKEVKQNEKIILINYSNGVMFRVCFVDGNTARIL